MDTLTAYSNTLGITKVEKKDLMSLLIYIPEVYHRFNQTVKTNKNISDPLVPKMNKIF